MSPFERRGKKVWDFLTDPNQIATCAPGVEKIETLEPNKRYRGVASIGLGAVKARFTGEIEILELEEPNRAKLKSAWHCFRQCSRRDQRNAAQRRSGGQYPGALDRGYQCIRSACKPGFAFDDAGFKKTIGSVLRRSSPQDRNRVPWRVLMHELIPDLIRWHSKNEQVGLAMVLQTWGSVPRPAGACMAFTSTGEFRGSVSGGCVENAVIETGLKVLKTGQAQLLSYKVIDEQAWEVGLSCGGSLEIFVTVFDPKMIGKVFQVIQELRKATWITCVRGSQTSLGKQMLSFDDGSVFGSIDPRYQPQLEALASETSRSGSTTRQFLDDDHEVFVQVLQPPPRLIVIGGVHIAQALVSLAKTLGFRTVLLDPRSAWNNLDRFPNVDQIIPDLAPGWSVRPADRFANRGCQPEP